MKRKTLFIILFTFVLGCLLLVALPNSSKWSSQSNETKPADFEKQQIETLFADFYLNGKYDNNTFCSELENVFKEEVDSLFIADIRDEVIQYLDVVADTLLIVEFAKEKFRIKTIHEYCEGLFSISNYCLRANNAYRYIAGEKLMDKYYNLTLSLLKQKDKALLIKDQELWMKSYESSREIAAIVAEENGGTEVWLFHYYYMSPNFMERTEYLFNWYRLLDYNHKNIP